MPSTSNKLIFYKMLIQPCFLVKKLSIHCQSKINKWPPIELCKKKKFQTHMWGRQEKKIRESFDFQATYSLIRLFIPPSGIKKIFSTYISFLDHLSKKMFWPSSHLMVKTTHSLRSTTKIYQDQRGENPILPINP